MTNELPNWMEKDRENDLCREYEQYKKRMRDSYPEDRWKYAEDRMQSLKKEHSILFFKKLGIFIFSEVVIISLLEGFWAGVLATLAFIIYVFVVQQFMKEEPDWNRLCDPRSDEEIQAGKELEYRLKNPDFDREKYLIKNHITEEDLRIEIDKEQRQIFFSSCPKPYSEYKDGPAIILTIYRSNNMPTHNDEYQIIFIKIEEVTSSGKKVLIYRKKYTGWPLSWSKDEACTIGCDKNLLVYGRDVVCDSYPTEEI